MRNLWLILLLSACSAEIADMPFEPPGPPGPPVLQPPDCSQRHPGRSPMRRLTVAEYDNAIATLFGDNSEPGRRLLDNERGVTSADARIVSVLLANQYITAAEDVSERATEDLEALIACDRGSDSEQVCAEAFVDEYGPRAYRRPLTRDERTGLLDVFATVREVLDFRNGVRAMIETLLQDPAFLYRVELPEPGATGIVRLDGYSLATRLAFFLWQSPPDDVLRNRAAEGELDSDEGVAQIAREMLADPRAEAALLGFFTHYLELDKLDDLDKDPETFPQFDETTPELFRQETRAFIQEVLRHENGNWQTLLTADWTMLNEDLARFYGIEGVSGSTFVRVPVDGAYHSGVLTQGSITATNGRSNSTHPIHRGMFVRAKLLCGTIPDVPEGLEVNAPDPDPSLTYREQLEQHRADPVCASCHALMDPLGFSLEHFGGDGRFRLQDQGLPIDATGMIVGSDVNGAFDGAPDLTARIIESPEAQECFGSAVFAYGFGRATSTEDVCSMQSTLDQFRSDDFDVRGLMLGLIQSEAFLYRVVDQDQFPSPPLGMTEEMEASP